MTVTPRCGLSCMVGAGRCIMRAQPTRSSQPLYPPAAYITPQVMSAVAYMHNLNIVHRDIKVRVRLLPLPLPLRRARAVLVISAWAAHVPAFVRAPLFGCVCEAPLLNPAEADPRVSSMLHSPRTSCSLAPWTTASRLARCCGSSSLTWAWCVWLRVAVRWRVAAGCRVWVKVSGPLIHRLSNGTGGSEPRARWAPECSAKANARRAMLLFGTYAAVWDLHGRSGH
mgnify:CR=1 FL=1